MPIDHRVAGLNRRIHEGNTTVEQRQTRAASPRSRRRMTAAIVIGIWLAASGLRMPEPGGGSPGSIVLVSSVRPVLAASTPPTPTNATAYSTIQCEDYDDQNGIHLEAHPGGLHAGFISNGDWLRFDKVGFTDDPAHRMTFRASNAARQNRTGKVELRLDKLSNAPIASMTIPDNGDWFSFITYDLNIPATVGVHTVFLVFTSTQDEEFANMDWIIFRH
jgi:Carbohydrate binding module (family 6)